jgi:hypothetical protein
VHPVGSSSPGTRVRTGGRSHRDDRAIAEGEPGYANSLHYDHGSLLKTLQEIFGVAPLLRHGPDPATSDLSDLYRGARLALSSMKSKSTVPWLTMTPMRLMTPVS